MRQLLVLILITASLTACVTETPDDTAEAEARSVIEVASVEPGLQVGDTAAALSAARTRVIQEASYALVGSHYTYNETNWPTATTFATFAYSSSDMGAWNLLASAYGSFTGCLRYRSDGYYQSTPCALSLSTGFGYLEQPSYACQGNCAGTYKRGGQCKGFINLVGYRSGIYQNPGYAWKSLPSDAAISSRPTTDPAMPAVTFANLEEGDFLRKPGVHAVLVVRKISSSQIVVLDSNWVGVSGGEVVGSHTMTIADLSGYRALKCVYTGAC